jgi:hypothetical protein
MSIMPQGEELRRAIQWISDQRRDEPSMSLQKIINEACVKFNLSPNEALYLQEWVTGEGDA